MRTNTVIQFSDESRVGGEGGRLPSIGTSNFFRAAGTAWPWRRQKFLHDRLPVGKTDIFCEASILQLLLRTVKEARGGNALGTVWPQNKNKKKNFARFVSLMTGVCPIEKSWISHKSNYISYVWCPIIWEANECDSWSVETNHQQIMWWLNNSRCCKCLWFHPDTNSFRFLIRSKYTCKHST